MVDIIKQDMTDLWAVSGDIVAPDSAKIQDGWGIEVVPRQWWNWMQNRADTNIAYVLQKGITEWDATTEYYANKSFVQRSGVVYRALLTGTNQDPLTATTYWAKAFADSTAASNALASVTPAADRLPYFTGASTAAVTTFTSFARTLLDDTTASAARTTLGAQASHANLTALSGVTAATNTLPYFDTATTMTGTSLTAFGRSLIDDADAAAGRTTLGLGTAATATLTTTTNDSTTGRVTRVGDFGLGGNMITIQSGDLNDRNITGFYTATTVTLNTPVFGRNYQVIHLERNTTYAIQLAYDIGLDDYWIRRRIAPTPTWTSWEKQQTSADITSSFVDTTANKLLKVGDFGIGGVAPQTSGDNLNNRVYSGFTNDTNPTNGITPGVTQNTISLYNSTGSGRSLQIGQVVNGTKLAFRHQNAGTWSSWYDLYTQGNTSADIQSFMGAANASAARTALGLGSAATATVTTGQYDITTGRLTKVGDFGVGAQGAPILLDMNTNTTSGIWGFDTSVGQATPTVNGPPAGNSQGVAFQLNYASSVQAQMVIASNLDEFWFRGRYSGVAGTWRTWYRVLSTKDAGAVGLDVLGSATQTDARTALGLGTAATATLTTSTSDGTVGRVLKVGDYSIGASAVVVSTGDVNDIDRPTGFYYISGAIPNRPDSLNGWLQHYYLNSGSGYAHQTYKTTGAKYYNRECLNGVWGAWREIFDSGSASTGTGSLVKASSPALAGVPTAPTAAVGTNTTQIATTAFVQANASANPAGAIIYHAANAIPAGYLKANGAAVSRTTYADLFAAIGTTYGAGNGSTTFNLPDLRGVWIRGFDDGRGVDTGRVFGSAQSDQNASHTHTASSSTTGAHTHTLSGTTNTTGAHTHTFNMLSSLGSGTTNPYPSSGAVFGTATTSSAGDHSHTISGTAASAGDHSHTITVNASGGTEVRVENVAMLALIKY